MNTNLGKRSRSVSHSRFTSRYLVSIVVLTQLFIDQQNVVASVSPPSGPPVVYVSDGGANNNSSSNSSNNTSNSSSENERQQSSRTNNKSWSLWSQLSGGDSSDDDGGEDTDTETEKLNDNVMDAMANPLQSMSNPDSIIEKRVETPVQSSKQQVTVEIETVIHREPGSNEMLPRSPTSSSIGQRFSDSTIWPPVDPIDWSSIETDAEASDSSSINELDWDNMMLDDGELFSADSVSSELTPPVREGWNDGSEQTAAIGPDVHLAASQPLDILQKLQQMLDDSDYLVSPSKSSQRRHGTTPSENQDPTSQMIDIRSSENDEIIKQQKLWTSRDRSKYKRQQKKLRRAQLRLLQQHLIDRRSIITSSMKRNLQSLLNSGDIRLSDIARAFRAREERKRQTSANVVQSRSSTNASLPKLPMRSDESTIENRMIIDDGEETDDEDGLGYTLPNLPVYYSDTEDASDEEDDSVNDDILFGRNFMPSPGGQTAVQETPHPPLNHPAAASDVTHLSRHQLLADLQLQQRQQQQERDRPPENTAGSNTTAAMDRAIPSGGNDSAESLQDPALRMKDEQIKQLTKRIQSLKPVDTSEPLSVTTSSLDPPKTSPSLTSTTRDERDDSQKSRDPSLLPWSSYAPVLPYQAPVRQSYGQSNYQFYHRPPYEERQQRMTTFQPMSPFPYPNNKQNANASTLQSHHLSHYPYHHQHHNHNFHPGASPFYSSEPATNNNNSTTYPTQYPISYPPYNHYEQHVPPFQRLYPYPSNAPYPYPIHPYYAAQQQAYAEQYAVWAASNGGDSGNSVRTYGSSPQAETSSSTEGSAGSHQAVYNGNPVTSTVTNRLPVPRTEQFRFSPPKLSAGGFRSNSNIQDPTMLHRLRNNLAFRPAATAIQSVEQALVSTQISPGDEGVVIPNQHESQLVTGSQQTLAEATSNASYGSLAKMSVMFFTVALLCYSAVSPRTLPLSDYNLRFFENIRVFSLATIGPAVVMASVFDARHNVDINTVINTFFVAFTIGYVMTFIFEILATTIIRLTVFGWLEPGVFAQLSPRVPVVILPWVLREKRYRPKRITLFAADLLVSCVAAPIIEEYSKLLLLQSTTTLPRNFNWVSRKKKRNKRRLVAEPIVRKEGEQDIVNANQYVTCMLAASLGLKLCDVGRRILMYTKPHHSHKAFYAVCRGWFPIQELCGTMTALELAKRDLLGIHVPMWKLLAPAVLIHAMANLRGMKPLFKWNSATPWSEMQLSPLNVPDASTLPQLLKKGYAKLMWAILLSRVIGYCIKNYYMVNRQALKLTTTYAGKRAAFSAEIATTEVLKNQRK